MTAGTSLLHDPAPGRAPSGGVTKMILIDAARAMSHPTRLLILNRLLAQSDVVSAKSVAVLNPEFTVSHADYHLKELQRLGVVRKHPKRRYLTDTPRPEWCYDLGGALAGKVRDVLDVSQGRKVIVSKAKSPLPFPKTDEELLALDRLLSHPVRVKAILALRKRRGRFLSPPEAAEMFKRPLATVSYSFSYLRRAGVVEIRGTRQHRGAIENLYALAGPGAPATLALLYVLAGRLELMEVRRDDTEHSGLDT